MSNSSFKFLSYDLVNVFIANGRTYSGNPLAVIYDAEGLTTEQCQTLGRQFNLSEITFPVEPAGADFESGTYQTRIFTPSTELDFAGHPTLGTCFALLHKKALLAKKGSATQVSGPAKIVTSLTYPDSLSSAYEPSRIAMRGLSRFVTERLPVLPELILPLLGLPTGKEAQVRFVRRASCGLAWIYICLDNVDAVKNISVGLKQLQNWCGKLKESVSEESRKERWFDGVSVFAFEPVGKTGDLQVHARVIFSENSVCVEDPATGSAALGLGCVLHAEELIKPGKSYAITQGVEINMPSQLFGSTEVDESGRLVAVHVAGDVVKVGNGQIRVPEE